MARAADGTKTTSRPASHASVPSTRRPGPAWPTVSARAASTASVTGLTSANARTAPGIADVGTNAEVTKVSG